MGWIKDEIESELKQTGFKSARRILKPSGYQIGSTNKRIDSSRKALVAGKRISKTGNIYYENRRNRSDEKGKSI